MYFWTINLEHQQSLESRSSSTSYMPLLTLEKIKLRLWVYSIIVIFSANKFKAFGLLVIPAIWSSLSINYLILCAPTDTTISVNQVGWWWSRCQNHPLTNNLLVTLTVVIRQPEVLSGSNFSQILQIFDSGGFYCQLAHNPIDTHYSVLAVRRSCCRK